jgi:hypothetical protein
MDRLLWFILEFFNGITLGALGRWGEPDPEEMREELHRHRERDRLALARLVGGVGVAATPLRSSGNVALHGRTYEAASEGNFIDRGTESEVIGSRGSVLVVRARSAPPDPRRNYPPSEERTN